MSRRAGLPLVLLLAAAPGGCGPSADELALCLPQTASLTSKCTVVNDSTGRVFNTDSMTVEQALRRLKVRVKGSKLYDSSGKEIFFHRPYAGGAPPGPEMQERERKELEDMCKRGTVLRIESPGANLLP